MPLITWMEPRSAFTNFSNSTTYQITNIRKPWTLNRFSSLSLCVSKLGNQRFTWSFFNSVDDDDVALIIHYFQVDLDFRNKLNFLTSTLYEVRNSPFFFAASLKKINSNSFIRHQVLEPKVRRQSMQWVAQLPWQVEKSPFESKPYF